MRVLVTGAAGFIGMHTAARLLADGHTVVGVDSLNDYYDPALKQARLSHLAGRPGFEFHQLDLADSAAVAKLFGDSAFTHVVHLAAQAGVRYSLLNPTRYVDSNIMGFVNVLEGCRHAKVAHLAYASSSSVYGANTKVPFVESDRVEQPVSLYAATKRANELMAYSYSHLFGFPTTGLRFFTVYGPWGRPDMAYFSFTDAILRGHAIPVFNEGRMRRDLTYIDDVVEGIARVTVKPATPPEGSTVASRLFNVGNHHPVPLMEMIATIERVVGVKARVELLPMQAGDVEETYADASALQEWVGFAPSTSFEAGMTNFVDWFRDYHGL